MKYYGLYQTCIHEQKNILKRSDTVSNYRYYSVKNSAVGR